VLQLRFVAPVTHVYCPLDYAWRPYEIYIRRFAAGRKRVLFLGMNPGPFGMAQTGIPFGDVESVRQWMKVETPIGKPRLEHPRRPVSGFDSPRSEVSGRRLWCFFQQRFGSADRFFAEHLVLNYCPLAFIEHNGRNRTPDKLSPAEKAPLFAACDAHLREAVAALQPEWVIGIGDFAWKRARSVFDSASPKLGRILHPSPANPRANHGWGQVVLQQLQEQGVWSSAR
jgi:single-strand selective monofunctional uracil DNA glycosylase